MKYSCSRTPGINLHWSLCAFSEVWLCVGTHICDSFASKAIVRHDGFRFVGLANCSRSIWSNMQAAFSMCWKFVAVFLCDPSLLILSIAAEQTSSRREHWCQRGEHFFCVNLSEQESKVARLEPQMEKKNVLRRQQTALSVRTTNLSFSDGSSWHFTRLLLVLLLWSEKNKCSILSVFDVIFPRHARKSSKHHRPLISHHV